MCGKIADMARDNPKELTREALLIGNPVSEHMLECESCGPILSRIYQVQA